MRIVVVGTSGSGKTTLALRIASAFDLPFIELDSLHWGPNWLALSETDPEEFARRVRNAVSADTWVSDGNYAKVRDLIWPRATHLVWLDYSRAVVMYRVIRRSLARALDQKEMWAGNRESLAPHVAAKPSHQVRVADLARTAIAIRVSVKRGAIRTFGGGSVATAARRGGRVRSA